MSSPDDNNLASVLASISEMVRAETQAQPIDAAFEAKIDRATLYANPATRPKPKPMKLGKPIPRARALAKVFILRPHMRVDIPKHKPEVLDEGDHIPYAPPHNDSFAIANPSIDEGMLREMVKEVVREQLMSEVGREIIEALKTDAILALSQKT